MKHDYAKLAEELLAESARTTGYANDLDNCRRLCTRAAATLAQAAEMEKALRGVLLRGHPASCMCYDCTRAWKEITE